MNRLNKSEGKKHMAKGIKENSSKRDVSSKNKKDNDEVNKIKSVEENIETSKVGKVEDKIEKVEIQQEKKVECEEKKDVKKFSLFKKDKRVQRIGIDLGTANTILYSNGKIILREPSVVALHRESGEMLAAGSEAKKMIGRTPGSIVAINPLRSGVIANFDITCRMIEFFLKKACGRRLARYTVRVCAPYGITDVEKRAIKESILTLGVKNVSLIEEPLAAAIGANLKVSEPTGSMVVDIGGGTTETAMISLGGIVTGISTRIGGDVLDESIVAYVRKHYNLLIAEKMAERLKMKIGTVDENRKDEMEIRGRDLVTGLPSSRIITSANVFEAIKGDVFELIQDIKATLEKSPPELASDIICNGIVLTGGGALLDGLDRLIERETLVPVRVAENPLDCVAIGTGLSLDVNI